MPGTGMCGNAGENSLGESLRKSLQLPQGKIVNGGFSSHCWLDTETFQARETLNNAAEYTVINASYIFFLMEIMQNRTWNSCVCKAQAKKAGTSVWGHLMYAFQLSITENKCQPTLLEEIIYLFIFIIECITKIITISRGDQRVCSPKMYKNMLLRYKQIIVKLVII